MAALQALIRQITHESPTWGQERIANELLLKLGLLVPSRTVRKVAVTATFRIFYVFMVIEHASRQLLHVNVTAYPTAD